MIMKKVKLFLSHGKRKLKPEIYTSLFFLFSQTPQVKLSEDLYKIILELDLERNFDVGEDGIEQISFAVIDLTGDQP